MTSHSSMDNASVKTRFLLLSDTHDLNLLNVSMPSADVVIHCGDITESGGVEQHKQAIEGLASIESELKLVIAGNHDMDLDPAYSSSQTSQTVEEMWATAAERGIHYLKEGTYEFTLSNGAVFSVYASPWTPEYGVSAFQYPPSEDRFNRDSADDAKNVCTADSYIPRGVDVLMTHGPPKYVLDQCADRFRSSGGCEHLRRAVCRVRPLLHCFGHIHNAWGAVRTRWTVPTIGEDDIIDLLPREFMGKNSSRKKGYASLSLETYKQIVAGEQTLFVNAALGNGNGEMANMPWIVDLDLRRAPTSELNSSDRSS